MQAAVRRPHFAAGVAFVGASVIAAAAVTPMPEIHLPDVQLPSIHVADVDLAALANPIELYTQVFQTALANTNTLIENTVPGQLLNQILQNQVRSGAALLSGLSTAGGGIAAAATQVPAALVTAVNQLTAGNVEGAVNTLLGVPLTIAAPALNLLPVLGTVLTQPLTNLVNVVNAFTKDPLVTLLAVSGFVAPLISAPAAAVAAVQNVINAVGTGNLGAVANAIVSAPATIADGILNGGYGPNLGPIAGIPESSGIIVKAGGLLSSNIGVVDPTTGLFVINTGGPVYALQQVLKMITQAIKPVAPTATIASLPTAAAATITLSTAPATTTDTTTPAAGAPATSADKPAVTDKTPSTPATTKGGSESANAPADSTTNTPSKTETDTSTKTPAEAPSKVSPTTKPTSSAPDVTTGNKVEPGTTAGADTPKPNGSNTSTAEKDGTPAAGSTTAAAGGTEKGAGAASGSEAKGSTAKASAA
jgi:hypothetical protein